jgi:glycosyltransferase involved in cell wall biosynthesis
MSIFNKDNILELILKSLFENTSNFVNEYIFILDGCTDTSEQILKTCIQDKTQQDNRFTYNILYTPDVFEIKSNNAGLKICKNEYAIIVQDDMQIMEKNWDLHLLKPMLQYDDIWAVTARTSCSLGLDGTWYNIIEGPVGHNYGKPTTLSRNIAYVGQVVNRGPLLVKISIMKDVGYFDETLPGCIGCDDVDICLKVYIKYKYRCCSYYIHYNSPLTWGSTRTGPNGCYCRNQELLNIAEILKRYNVLLATWNCDETRIVL